MSDYRTIIVGAGGSRSSLLTVERAASIAAALDAILVTGCAYYETAEGASKTLRQDSVQVLGDDPAQRNLATAREAAKAVGATEVKTEVCSGSSVEVLISLVTDRHVDLLVTGNRGIDSLTGRLPGSVPADAARQLDRDVMIVHTVS